MSVNFINFIVAPFYSKVVKILPDLQFTLEIADENYQRWVLIKELEERARLDAPPEASQEIK